MIQLIKNTVKKTKFGVQLFHSYLRIKCELQNLLIYGMLFFKKMSKSRIDKKDKEIILVCMYKYIKGTNIASNETFNLLNSLRKFSQDKYTIEVYYYEDYKKPLKDDLLLLKILKDKNFDYIFLSSYSGINPYQPKVAIFEYIIKMNDFTKILNLMWDTASLMTFSNYKSVLQIASLSVIVDGSDFYDRYKNKFNLVKLFAPQDQDLYYADDKIEKDINVLFLGKKTAYRSYRNKYLEYLKEQNIDVYVGGGDSENPICAKEYARLTQRAKIIINFSMSVENKHQLKGRVFEALFCKSCLFESKNNITPTYFEKNIEYVEYEGEEDLANKIKSYLKNPDKLKIISNNGFMKASKNYNYIIFWKNIFNELKG